MAPSLQRMQRWAEQRLPALTRFRQPEPLPIELHRRRIYIVPTAFGLGFGMLLLVMLVGSLNYTNNAALLLTCLLGAASMSSMLVAFRALDGLVLGTIRAGHAIAGQPIDLHLVFNAPRARESVRVDLGEQQQAFALAAGAEAELTFALPTEHRGWQALPRVRVWSTWPLGLFRAWSWLYPEQSVLVWPRPEPLGPAPQAPDDDPARQRQHRGDDLAALRDYRAGDPQRHIAWKASARHEGLLVKDFEQPQSYQEWRLDWRELPHLDGESRIARLARWVGEAHAQGRRYSLWLPSQEIAAGSGADQYARCMSALALLP
ncbi:DUF58 domain-containing protein [Dyella sp.]|jgi:uncharacterized protein (DUF58 family)|uniref:DUF58 domain-containing protein n=1 Tax=Dyella sp. TaxID=1869338 RepID=UPI002D77F571|nr:DUF58 domain-containing protein [Dyella sp.]HET6433921.1 DUF58 domain-containing protein [Dyella sp.]